MAANTLTQYWLGSESSYVTEQTAYTDTQLIERIAMGDQQALEDLFVHYRLLLLQYLLQFTTDYGLAEELLQDTFIAVWQNARSFEGRSQVKAWLLGVARRRALKMFRRQEISFTDVADLVETLPASDPEPEASLLEGVAFAELMATMRQLSAVHREVLMLLFVHGLSYLEIAEVLNTSIGTVKSRLNNAKKAWRTLLHEEKR